MEAPVQLSVVVPCRNEAEKISELLQALAGQRSAEPWEVVVADNGSTDETRLAVSRFADSVPGLRIVEAGRVPGASFARNVGAAAAEGRWLIFCDADDVPGVDWLPAMMGALADHPVVIPRFEGERLNPGASFRPLGQQTGLDQLWYPPYLYHSGGSGIGARMECHQEIGGFDESLRICEDTDYTIRLQQAGYPLYFEPRAVLHIRYPSSAGYFWQARTWARANTTIYRRHGRQVEPQSRQPWKWFLLGLWAIARRLPRVRNARVRAITLWHAGWHLGLLEGALRQRVPPVSFPPKAKGSR